MRLLRTELLRARSRRSVLVLALAGVLLSIGLGAAAAWDARPYTSDETAQAENRAEREFKRCERQVAKHDDSKRQCEMRIRPWAYGRWREPLNDKGVEDGTVSLSISLMLVAGLVGASFIGGEFSSGSMGNLLSFAPRRTRVWFAKLAVTGLLALVWSAICVGGYVAAMTALGRAWDPGTWPPHWIGSMLGLGARGAIAVAVAAVIGAALTLAVRSTLATVGVVIGYVLVVEGIARIVFPSVIEYALSSRILGVLFGSHVLEIESGRSYDQITVTLQNSALILAGVCVVVGLISLVTFRRRDID